MAPNNGATPSGTSPNTRTECITIAATPARVWQALTDKDESATWYYGTGIESTWTEGATYRYVHPDNEVAIEGRLTRLDPPSVMDMTFSARWAADVAADEPTRVVWVVTDQDGSSQVCVTHEGLQPGTATAEQVATGWPELLTRLKKFVETGNPNG